MSNGVLGCADGGHQVCVSVKLKVEITKYRLPTYIYEFISTSLLGLWAVAMIRPTKNLCLQAEAFNTESLTGGIAVILKKTIIFGKKKIIWQGN